jgi:hypothetical protein
MHVSLVPFLEKNTSLFMKVRRADRQQWPGGCWLLAAPPCWVEQQLLP